MWQPASRRAEIYVLFNQYENSNFSLTLLEVEDSSQFQALIDCTLKYTTLGKVILRKSGIEK